MITIINSSTVTHLLHHCLSHFYYIIDEPISRNDLNELEELSSTDVKCIWAEKKKRGNFNYSAKKIKDFCHVRQLQPSDQNVSKELRSNAVKILLDASPDSAFLLHR
jgi:ribosome biogenesis protein Nip4